MSNIITNVKKDIPVMKLFIKEGNFYVYDTYNNLILRVNAGQYQELTKLYKYGIHWYKNLKTNMQSYKDIIMLLERGFFREPWIEKIEHPLTYLVEDIVTRKSKRPSIIKNIQEIKLYDITSYPRLQF